jgi:hypothetical protein
MSVRKSGQSFEFGDMIRFLSEQKVAKQYMPERLEYIDALPMTPSGKVWYLCRRYDRSPTATAIAKRSINADTDLIAGIAALGLQAL